MFSKSFANIKRDMSTGQGFGYSLFGNSIKSNDVTAINNYANALKNGASVGEAWRTTMNGTSVAAKQYVLNARKAGKSTAELTQGLNNMTLGAKASTVAMKALGVAKNVALNVGTMLLISGVMKVIGKISEEIDDFIHRAEIAREKSTELTRAWNEENTSIGSSISKYKELKESLDSGTLSTQEIANAKNELAEIQDTLTSKYGQEALGIDLVNGKYDEQIKKLDELSRKKAEDYTAENYANIQEDIKYVNNSVKVDEELDSGAVFNPDTYNKYLKKYLDEYDALTTRLTDRNGIVGSSGLNIVGEGTREEIYNQLTSLFNDLSRDFGEDNPDVNKLKTALSGIISDSFDTEKMEQAKSNIKQYAEAQILSQNNTRQLYEDAINAVDNYNKALASGQGVEEAKANLDEVKQKVTDNTSGISGAGQVFEDVWGGISEGAKTTSENVNKMTVSLSELEGASDKIKTLGSAFKELSDDGYITTKTLGEIQTATGLSGDEWAEYESKLLNAKKGSAEFSQIMADLTYKMLDQTFANKDLNSLTEQQISAILRENGVVNADAVAHDWLTKAKETLRIKTALAKASTAEEVVALATEASQAGTTGNALNDLIMDMGIFNNTNLDVSQKVAALQEMGYYAHWTAQGLANIDKVKKYSFDGKDYIASYDKDGKLVGVEQEKQVEIPNVEIPKITIPNYSGAASGGKSGSDNKPDYEDPTDAIINRINLRSKEIEKQEEEIQNLIEIAELENDYKKQISLTNDLIAKRKQRVDELNRANDGLHEEAEKLRNSNPWDEENWFDSQGNATEEYYRIFNSASSKKEQEQIKDLFDAISKIKKTWIDNNKEIINTNKQVLQDEENLWDIRRQIFDDRLELSENYIERSKNFGWDNSDNEIAARKRVLEWIESEYYRSLIKDDKEYYKILEENRLKYNEALEDDFNKATDFASSYYDSKKTLLQSYFDVTNSIAEAQHEINKELAASKTMYEYLDEDTRKLLFNQEDYNALSKELIDIQSEADRLKRRHEYDLDNATLNTIEEITSNYEMQYEMLMKSYEIAKADLEIAKKKQKLDNVLNERNVRMRINGEWQYVANTQDVIEAQSELADAEYAKKTAMAGKRQEESINDLTSKQDELGTTISLFEDGVIDLTTAVGNVKDIFGELPAYISGIFNNILSSISSAQGSSSSKSWGSGKSGGSSGSNATATIPGVGVVGVHVNSAGKTTTSGLPNGTVVHTSGGDYEITGGSGGNYTSKKVEKHAAGTRFTPGGLTELGEVEPETFIDNNGHLIPINQPTIGNIGAGGIVFNQDQMTNLRSLWDLSNIGTMPHTTISNMTNKHISETINYQLFGDMIFDGNNPEEIFKKMADFFKNTRYKSN